MARPSKREKINLLETISRSRTEEPYKYKAVGRDYEYIRHGAQSLLAGIDPLMGEITAYMSDTHKSSDLSNF